MKRENVRNLKEVKDLTQNVQQLAADLGSEFDNVKDIITDMSSQLSDSLKYSEQNKNEARDLARSYNSVLRFASDSGIKNRALLGIERLRVKFASDLTDEQKEGFEALANQAVEQAKGVALAEQLKGKLADAGSNIAAAVVGALSFSGIIAGIVKIATSFSQRIDDIGKSFGVLASDEGFVKNLTDAELNVVGIGKGLDDVVEVTSQLTTNFGLTLDEASKLSDDIVRQGVALGLSNSEATELFGTLSEVTGLSGEQVINFQESTMALARQAGVAPVSVFRDIANSADDVASFTDSTGDNIARAAIQAQRLGVGLSTTAKVAESLLDFQSSVAAETEASVLIGRQLNFQKARELALNNNIAGAVENVIAQLGSEEQFTSLNLLQRQALARAVGLSTAELAKFVGKQEEVNNLSDVFARGPSLVETLKADDALSNLTKIIAQFQKLGTAIINAIGPGIETFVGDLLVELKQFTEEGGLLDKIKSIGETIADGFRAAGDALNVIVPVAAGLAASLTTAAIAAAFATGGGSLLAAGAVLGAGALGAFIAAQSFHDLPSGTMAVAQEQDSVVNMTTGEAVARIEDINRPTEVMVHADNSDVVEAIKSLVLDVKVSRDDLQFILNSGAGV